MRLGRLCCLCALAFSTVAYAEINGEGPPYALTLDQVKNWGVDSPFVSAKNVSSVPLARRIAAPLSYDRANLDAQAKVLYAPDGLNNFASYIDAQPKFNLYNFTHWSQIDVLNFFGGTAVNSVQVPSRPWVETAHKNGVKVIGSVFFAVTVYGGNANTVEQLLTQGKSGNFIYADRLIEIAEYYGFDGWLMNQETDLQVVKDDNNEVIPGKKDKKRAKDLAERMLAFMKYFTAKAPPGMEIHWYDSMLTDGRVRWQNELNEANKFFLQDAVPSADAIFLNYWWNKSMVESSYQLAKALGRSHYDLYFGADLWPTRNAQASFNKTQWLSWLFNEEGTQALASIALFAPNLNYNFSGFEDLPAFSRFIEDAEDYASFYETEQRLFVGDDLNLATNDTQGWPGIGRYLPAKSTINRLPFTTNFSTGQGKLMMERGKKTGGAWTNMALQALLPTWQFAIQGNATVSLAYDFEQPFDGGNSLLIKGDASKGKAVMPLYQVDVQLRQDSVLNFIQSGAHPALSVYLETISGKQYSFALKSDAGAEDLWAEHSYALDKYAGEHITKIGLILDDNASGEFSVRLGQLTLR